MLDLFTVQIHQESLRLDTDSIMKSLVSEVNSLSEISSLFSFTYYIKGKTLQIQNYNSLYISIIKYPIREIGSILKQFNFILYKYEFILNLKENRSRIKKMFFCLQNQL